MIQYNYDGFLKVKRAKQNCFALSIFFIKISYPKATRLKSVTFKSASTLFK
jgi:hypothetical protein